MKHTKGPWVVYDDTNDGKTSRIEIAARGKTIARIYLSVAEEDFSNADLISAAPDMLEALRLAAHRFHYLTDPKDKATYSVIRAAIAKAAGGKP